MFGNLGQRQRAGRRHDAFLVDLDAPEPGHIGAGGDHDGFGLERLRLAAGKVDVTGADGKTQTLETKSIVIATGSDVAKLKGIAVSYTHLRAHETGRKLV